MSPELDAAGEPDDVSVTGVLVDFVYAGAVTRFVVRLDDGPTMTVVEQNTETAPDRFARDRGARVRLSWRRTSCISLTRHS